MRTNLLSLPLFCSLLSGCFIFTPRQLGEIDPHPNVLLAQSPRRIALEFGPAVPEKTTVPGEPVFLGIDVDRWHESLSRGFHNGMARYFGKDAPGLRLVILRADPKLLSDGVEAGSYGARSATGIIAYQAELVDEAGTKLAFFSGTAVSPQHVISPDGTPDVMLHAIDEMYERIASQMPAHL